MIAQFAFVEVTFPGRGNSKVDFRVRASDEGLVGW
jgi:hypothetical protein